MPRDDRRDDSGKFAHITGSYRVPYFSNEPLEKHIEYKTSTVDMRELDIMFDQHRKLFGWSTKSDLYREQGYLGKKMIIEAIADPDPELLELFQQEEEMLKIVKRLRRHQHVERVIREMDETIRELEARRDYGAIRRALTDIKALIKDTKDAVLHQAMQQEFDNRWERLWQDLNRGARLPVD